MTVRVTFLGVGDAFNACGSGHAACLVESSSTVFLIDCGPTALLGLKRQGLTAADIDTVILSHLHGDHFGGVPFLLLECVSETPRKGPFTVAGPPHAGDRIQELYSALYKQIATHRLPFEYRCIEVVPGERIILGAIDLVTFPVPHQASDISLGLRIGIDGKSILYSGDTGWTEELVRQAQGVDLFICECTYFETRVDFHLDYRCLQANYPRFGCRRLVLTHLGREVHERRDEVKLEVAHDGMTIEL